METPEELARRQLRILVAFRTGTLNRVSSRRREIADQVFGELRLLLDYAVAIGAEHSYEYYPGWDMHSLTYFNPGTKPGSNYTIIDCFLCHNSYGRDMAPHIFLFNSATDPFFKSLIEQLKTAC